MKKIAFTLAEVFHQADKSKRVAFTLAEVLITLGIIGVVAAITIPSLIAKHQEKVTATKLKKAYNIVNQAYMNAKQEYGDLPGWGFRANSTEVDEENRNFNKNAMNNMEIFWSKLIPYMNVTEKCFSNENKNCAFKKQGLNNIDLKENYTSYINLNDGISLTGGFFNKALSCSDKANEYCGDFAIDINGIDTAPNVVGKDIFYFMIFKNRILPFGVQESYSYRTFNKDCINNGNGYGCSAWVIYNENMDYLHCPEKLGWNKKHSCK